MTVWNRAIKPGLKEPWSRLLAWDSQNPRNPPYPAKEVKAFLTPDEIE
jgi:hypothetical protein